MLCYIILCYDSEKWYRQGGGTSQNASSECSTSIDKMRLLRNGQRMIYACHSSCGGLMVCKEGAVLILWEPITLACSVDCVNWRQSHCKYTPKVPWEMSCSVIFYQVFIFLRTAQAGIEVQRWLFPTLWRLFLGEFCFLWGL